MPRLNRRALEILRAELEKCASGDLASQVQRDIVLKRLKKLNFQPGSSASLEELRVAVIDMFPTFSQRVLKVAARANRPSGQWGKIKFAAALLVGMTGSLSVLNLPYPMIRWPVARTAPILLLPSFIAMDYHYRQAIALVEQADQLVNHPTSPADLTLGAVKVKQAQNHLDALPVWFLGYFPQYRFWSGWRFTFDEFRAARANVGRMEAKLFQEKQAQSLLLRVEQTLSTAKQQYQIAKTVTARSEALAAWQAALDILQQIPPETLAGQVAQTKLTAYMRNYETVEGLAAGNARSGTMIEAAQEFARSAIQASQDPPHTAAEWSKAQTLWETAINRLEQIPVEDPGYTSAQKLLATYQRNLGTVQTRLQAEEKAVDDLNQAQEAIQDLIGHDSSVGRNQIISQLQNITDQLETIPPGTTTYPKAQSLLKSAQQKREQLLSQKG